MTWRKGESGNPRGRLTGSGGREKLISDRLRVHLKRPWKGKDDEEEVTNADRIAEVLVEAATNGEAWAISQVFDRIEGKAVQPLEHAGDSEVRVIVASGLVREQQIVDADYQEAETVPTKLIETKASGTNGSNGHG
jgi:hypothetical protein